MRMYCDTCAHARPVLPDGMTCAAGHTPKFRLPDTPASTSWGYFRSNCADHALRGEQRAAIPLPRDSASHITPTPDEAAALQLMLEGWQRLKALGWRDAIYAPTDGTPLHLIEAGCTGIAHGQRDDERRFWSYDGDIWPAHPCLFRRAAVLTQEEPSERHR